MLKKLTVLLLIVLTMSACDLINPFFGPFLPPLPATIEPAPTQTQGIMAPVAPSVTIAATSTSIPPTFTPTLVVPNATVKPSETAVSVSATPVVMLFQVQANTPMHIANFAHASAGCQWMSVAGQVFDAAGNPVLNLVLHVSGVLDGQPFDQVGMSGVALSYGPGGYEIKLADKGIASTNTLAIQLFNLQGQVISNAVTFKTYADCSKAITLINFGP